MSKRAPDGEVTQIFLHLPKTGGRTLETVFRRQFRSERVYGVYAPSPDEAVDRYERLDDDEKRRYRAIAGHVAVTMHEMVPGPCVYVTLLRDPVKRVISSYYYARRNTGHPEHRTIVENDMSLPEVVRSGIIPMFDNGQARVLGDWWGEYGTCPPEAADWAMENIDRHVAVAGLTERYDESLLLMGLELGWSWTKMPYVRHNVAPSRPHAEDLPEETVELIREFNRVDLELYRRVEERFERRIEATGAGFRALAAAFPLMKWVHAHQRGLRARARRLLGADRPTGGDGR